MIDQIICGDCLDVLKTLPEDSVDAIVTDPPAGIAFMGKEWDQDKGGRDEWIGWMAQVASECLRVIKPGGHALVWALPRTSHWTGMAWEEAGWEPRDKIAHVFGSGFPKSLSIDKALDKMAGAEREVIGIREDFNKRARKNGVPSSDYIMAGGWKSTSETVGILTAPATPAAKQWAGWGSAIKPSHEDWWLFRKPLSEKTIAENVLRWGTGGLNIDGCRISTKESTIRPNGIGMFHADIKESTGGSIAGRFPANLIHDGSPEVLAEFAKAGETKSGAMKREVSAYEGESTTGFLRGRSGPSNQHGDSGSVSRFFKSCQFTEEDLPTFMYCAKASPSERNGSTHPTVKPLSLMRYLCRLITPPRGIVLDPFAGSGTTCLAAKLEGFGYIGIEKEAEYHEIARKRIAAVPARLDRWAEAGT